MRKRTLGLAGAILAAAVFAFSNFYAPSSVNPAVTGMGAALPDATEMGFESPLSAAQTDEASSGAVRIEGISSGATETDAVTSGAVQTGAAAGRITAEADPIKVPETEGIVPGGHVQARVTDIVDGDTVKVEIDKKEYRVRLLCIDTPESVKSGVPVQPFGKEAAEKIYELILGKDVTLVFEKDVDDRYGRLLAFIITKDDCCVNAELVEQGFARIEIVRPNTEYREYFESLQDEAIREKRGLWSLPEKKRPFVMNKDGYYVPRYIDDAA